MSSLPQVLYHVIEEPNTVHTEEERDELLAAGWEESPVERSTRALLVAAIAKAEKHVEDLYEKLGRMDGAAEDEPKSAVHERMAKARAARKENKA